MEKASLFKPGCAPGPGRPKGSTEKPWLKPDYWHDLILAEWDGLKPSERATIAMKGFATAFPRVIGPQTPEESMSNADAAFKMLKLLQEVSLGSHPGVSASGDSSSLEDGRSSTQTPQAPA